MLWCAEELGLTYEHINAGGTFGVVSDPDYLAMNPNGLVPCLKDGDLVLWESNAIFRYLARQYAYPSRLPNIIMPVASYSTNGIRFGPKSR